MQLNPIIGRAFPLSVIAAQLTVPVRREFKGTVATVGTRELWRTTEQFGGVGVVQSTETAMASHTG